MSAEFNREEKEQCKIAKAQLFNIAPYYSYYINIKYDIGVKSQVKF